MTWDNENTNNNNEGANDLAPSMWIRLEESLIRKSMKIIVGFHIRTNKQLLTKGSSFNWKSRSVDGHGFTLVDKVYYLQKNSRGQKYNTTKKYRKQNWRN